MPTGGPYEFTRDWFAEGPAHEWHRVFEGAIGKSDMHFLEIGSYEGASAVWLIDNVLTGPGRMLTCVDPWAHHPEHPCVDWEAVYARFTRNVAACSQPRIVRYFKTPSAKMLTDMASMLAAPAYNAIYIDGSHDAADVLRDAVLAWPLLKRTGLMLFDDYEWTREGGGTNNPKTGIDAFMAAYAGRYEQIVSGYQVGLAKI